MSEAYNRSLLDREQHLLSNRRVGPVEPAPRSPLGQLADAGVDREPEVDLFFRGLGIAAVAAGAAAVVTQAYAACALQIGTLAKGDTTMWFLLTAFGVCVLGGLVALGVLLYSAYEQQQAMDEERRP